MRSQLGFTSIRLPMAGRSSNLWNRIFNFARSRHSGSLALVSADGDEVVPSQGTSREPERNHTHRGLFSVESDDTDTESERREAAGACGGVAAPLPQKVPPTTAVEAPGGAGGSSSTPSTRGGHGGHSDSGRDASSAEPPGVSPARQQLSSALSRMTQGLRWVRLTLGRSSSASQNQSPLRQLDTGVSGREEDDDVEMLIPVSEGASDSDGNDCSRPLLDLASGQGQGVRPPSTATNAGARPGGRDGPCERCGVVHTAQVPDRCLEATLKHETSDDEALLLC